MGVDSTQHCEQTLMFTDIVGYSRLMGRNESLAVEMLGDYRKILLSHIEEQGGQLVEFVGDAIFARFDTATAAVAAAIAIQQHLLAFNEARDKKLPRLQTRIGLNKGEVMLREGAVFGDAVNIAARLEPLAVADGICISQSVYDEVRFSLSSPAKRLGVQPLKNIQQKIRVYFIKPAGIGWRDHLHYFLRGLNRKIVACRYPIAVSVLALIAAGFYFIPRWLVPGYAANYVEIADFKNLMNEKGDADYFSAGITEAVRSQLADMRDVYIVDAKEGIHAPIRLEGSVQKLGDNLRIAYRLFRRKDNVQIAGGKLDGTYQDIFILQDRLVGEIARYLADEFQLQNFRPAPLRLTNDITAYDFYLKGLDYLQKSTMHENVDRAIQNFNSALLHDSNFNLALVGLCRSYRQKWELLRLYEWLLEAEKYCQKSLLIDDRRGEGAVAIGMVYRSMGKYELAIKYLEKGVGLNNENEGVLVSLALAYDAAGRRADAERIFSDLISRKPKNWRTYAGYARVLNSRGRYSEALDMYKNALTMTPENLSVLNNMGAIYVEIGEFSAAADAFERASKIEPNSAIFSNLGFIYYLNGEFESAIKNYSMASSLDPDGYKWLLHMADASRFVDGKSEKAMSLYASSAANAKKILANNPYLDEPYHYLAVAFAYMGDRDGALNALKEAERIGGDPINLEYAKLRVYLCFLDVKNVIASSKNLEELGYSRVLLFGDPDFKRFNATK